ncbi:MAG: twin-arginine translocase TatA/TatE family subunit [Flavobacteriales bacterium]|nr:twin-arginine translocase TatA/TatE family subunit [Flavobacteriales bacterium]
MKILLFGISGGEIFIVILFVLIFFGADKIPGFARTMGRTIRQVKDATGEIQRDIQNSVNDVKREVEKGSDSDKPSEGK